MKFSLTIPVTLTIGFLLLISAQVAAQKPSTDSDKIEEPPLSFWMEKKIEYSQQMLRGLVTGDLDQVAEKAEQMRLLSKVEGWIRGKKPGYRMQLQVFEFANNEILRQSQHKNLEGTTLAFQQLTAACVSCHRTLRETNGGSAKGANRSGR